MGDIQIGNFTLTPKDLLRHGMTNSDPLLEKESKLLRYLYAHLGEVVLKKDAIRDIWGNGDEFFNTRSADVYITRLRKKLHTDPSVRLELVQPAGWQLIIREEGATAPPPPGPTGPATIGFPGGHPPERPSSGRKRKNIAIIIIIAATALLLTILLYCLLRPKADAQVQVSGYIYKAIVAPPGVGSNDTTYIFHVLTNEDGEINHYHFHVSKEQFYRYAINDPIRLTISRDTYKISIVEEQGRQKK